MLQLQFATRFNNAETNRVMFLFRFSIIHSMLIILKIGTGFLYWHAGSVFTPQISLFTLLLRFPIFVQTEWHLFDLLPEGRDYIGSQ